MQCRRTDATNQGILSYAVPDNLLVAPVGEVSKIAPMLSDPRLTWTLCEYASRAR